MSLKEKFESHPVVWGLSLLLIGSIAGFGFNETISKKISPEQRPKTETVLPQQIYCKIEGLEKLAETHHDRVAALQGQLMKHESGASDGTLMVSYRQEHKDSAKRIRKDIEIENSIYKENVSNLEKKCN